MNAIERLLVFIVGAIFAAISVFLFIVAKPMYEFVYAHLPADVPLRQSHVEIIVYAIIVIFGLRALQLIARSIRIDKRQAPSINTKTELGEIEISMETLENLSLKAVSKIKGIHEVKAQVRTAEQGLRIKLKCQVDGELVIPQLSSEMQKAVKAHVELIAGIPVQQVVIRVANIQKTHEPRSRLN
jgi:uncharacterized alkaline shock family protein YloU